MTKEQPAISLTLRSKLRQNNAKLCDIGSGQVAIVPRNLDKSTLPEGLSEHNFVITTPNGAEIRYPFAKKDYGDDLQSFLAARDSFRHQDNLKFYATSKENGAWKPPYRFTFVPQIKRETLEEIIGAGTDLTAKQNLALTYYQISRKHLLTSRRDPDGTPNNQNQTNAETETSESTGDPSEMSTDTSWVSHVTSSGAQNALSPS